MRINSLIVKNLKQSKKQQCFMITCFTAIILCLIILINSLISINKTINNDIKNQFSNRDIIVKLDQELHEDIFEKMKDNNKVSKYYKFLNPVNLLSDTNENITLQGMPEDGYPILKDKIKTQLENENYVIIPIEFLNKNKLSVGDEIKFLYNQNVSFNAIILGVYESNSKENDVINIYTSTESFEEFIFENNLQDFNNSYHLIAINQSDVDDIILELSSFNIKAYPNDLSGKLELNMYAGLSKTITSFIIIISCILIFAIFLIISLIVTKETSNIAIMKALGYNEKVLNLNIFTILFSKIFFAYILSLTFYGIFIMIAKNILRIRLIKYLSFNIEISILLLLLIIAILFIIIIVNTIRLKRISIIKLIKDVE